jgi:hypothetical protein
VQAITEYLHLRNRQTVQIRAGIPDKVLWRWIANGVYTVKSACNMMHKGSIPFLNHELEDVGAPHSENLPLASLQAAAVDGRTTGAARTSRKSFCGMCDQEPETCDHKFLFCSYTIQLWFMIFTALRMVSLAPNQEHDLRQWSQARMLYLGQKQKGFDTLVALTTWKVWKGRYARVFRNSSSSTEQLLPPSHDIRPNHFLFMSHDIRRALSRGTYIDTVVIVLRERIKCVSWSLNRR